MPASTRLSRNFSTANRSILAVAAAVAVTLIAALTVGPVATAAPAKPGKSQLSGRTFISETVSGNNPLPGGGPITMVFGTTNQVSVNAGCNQLRSTVDLARGRLRVAQPMASTRKACGGAVKGADGWITGFLKQKPTWRLDDADLTLNTGNVRIRLVDRKEAADRSLVGSKWNVVALLTKGTPSTPPALTRAAPTLRFNNFQVFGTTGCNGLSGAAIPVTSMIVFGPVTTTGRPCKDPGKRQVEKSLVKALSGLQNYVVDGKKLAVVNSEGVGFIARTDR
ncbi:META domain-containing protein [Gordonia sp. CPCC 205333]|uniref:META domain-containing protein n=1 Tax=Gordonia sp. CPCC 205333 TaxID=3140790 RepID=UPI003AF378D0